MHRAVRQSSPAWRESWEGTGGPARVAAALLAGGGEDGRAGVRVVASGS